MNDHNLEINYYKTKITIKPYQKESLAVFFIIKLKVVPEFILFGVVNMLILLISNYV